MTGLTQIVRQHTHGAIVLDQLYELYPIYNIDVPFKTTKVTTFRKSLLLKMQRFSHTSRHLEMSGKVSKIAKTCKSNLTDPTVVLSTCLISSTLPYPENTITLTLLDPESVTPATKASLHRKNRLIHSGMVEEASALAARIGRKIARSSEKRLCKPR